MTYLFFFLAGCVCGVVTCLIMVWYSERLADRVISKYKTENHIKDKHQTVFPTYEDKLESIENDKIRKNYTKESRLRDAIKSANTSFKGIRDQHI